MTKYLKLLILLERCARKVLEVLWLEHSKGQEVLEIQEVLHIEYSEFSTTSMLNSELEEKPRAGF